jgi:GT2 family glycosyltransferase
MAGVSPPSPSGAPPRVGVVVIGRNEAAHLEGCLRSVASAGRSVVYVDSGSSDQSVAIARARGATVVELDAARPFTAARSRNEGFARLRELDPALEAVQFVDGDCELAEGWIEAAAQALADEPQLAAVCGHLRETRGDASLYNRIVALDWAMQRPGDGAYSGIVLVRARPFAAIGGFATDLIAGEDPDLAFRLIEAGFRTRRIDRRMALHDAGLTSFGQWWRRTLRTGHADAELAWRHRRSPRRDRWREALSSLLFGLALPIAAVAAALLFSPWWLALLAVYSLLWLKVRAAASAAPPEARSLYASACVAAKLPQALGVARFALALFRILPRRRLIE